MATSSAELEEAKRKEAENAIALKELREEIKKVKTGIEKLEVKEEEGTLSNTEAQRLHDLREEKKGLDAQATSLIHTDLCKTDNIRVTQLKARQGAGTACNVFIPC